MTNEQNNAAKLDNLVGQSFVIKDQLSTLYWDREQFRGLNVQIVAPGGMVGAYCVRFTDSVEHIVNVMSQRSDFWTKATVLQYIKNEDALCEYDLDQLQRA